MSGDAGTWLGVIALAIPAGTIAATIPRGLRRMDLRRRGETSAAQAMAADRAALLSRVRDKWIDGVLEPSLAHTERLALDQPPVLQVFLRTGGGLLILGAPGGGKTTLLLELADGLLERAGSDPSQPVPVVASLASWTGRRQQLDAWLADELAASYRIPQATARDWAAQNDLVLLLDGLDEVDERYRDSCAEAINRFLRDRPIARMAVCCRTETARSLGTELALPQTVELRPVARSQVDSYLARLETTWTPLADIRAALAADEGLRVPLMLKIAALANRGRPLPARQQDRVPRWLRAPEWPQEIAEIFAPVPPETVKQAPLDQATMWEAYVARMLEHRSLTPGREYDATTARRSLAWLAARLRDSGQAEFQLDQLPAGGPAGPARELRRILRHAALWTDRYVHTTALDLARLLETRGRGTEDHAEARFRIATANWLRDHLAQARPGGWLRHLPQALIRPAAEVGWSPDRLPSLTPPVTALIALPVTAAIAAVLGGWPLALAAALCEGLLWGLNLPDRLGLKPRARRHRTVPNESIRRSARHATMIGLATAACFGTGLGLVSIVMGGLTTQAIVAAALLAGAGAGVSNGAGACAHHYIARLRLARDGVIPWRYQRFLDAMAERMLLHRSGSGYLFIHRLLADHLANNHTNPVNMIENTPPGLANTEPIPVALPHEQAYRADQPPSQRVSHRAQQPAGRHSAGAG
jgi:hypothetical protein